MGDDESAESGRPAVSDGRPRRTGRRPGETATRDAITQVARLAFLEHGYEGVSLREIARRASVDAALIIHFFGSKAGLFVATVDYPYDPGADIDQFLSHGRDHVGLALAQRFVHNWDQPDQRRQILSLHHIAFTDPAAAQLLRELISARFLEPLLRRIDSDHVDLRAGLLAAQFTGFGVGRYVLGYPGLRDPSTDELVRAFGWSLQTICTGPFDAQLSAEPSPGVADTTPRRRRRSRPVDTGAGGARRARGRSQP